MKTLINSKIIKETEKAFCLSFDGLDSKSFSTIEMWIPKSRVKKENENFLLKENGKFFMDFIANLSIKINENEKREESEAGVIFGDKVFKINENGKLWFNGDIFSFSVGWKEKDPSGYYENHRKIKGETDFGKVFFITGIPEDEKNVIESLKN